MFGILFLIVMDRKRRKTVCERENEISWKLISIKTGRLDDFANDFVLLYSSRKQIQDKSTKIDEEPKRVGLKTNLKKGKRPENQCKKPDKG